jgi:hypothetical protein
LGTYTTLFNPNAEACNTFIAHVLDVLSKLLFLCMLSFIG